MRPACSLPPSNRGGSPKRHVGNAACHRRWLVHPCSLLSPITIRATRDDILFFTGVGGKLDAAQAVRTAIVEDDEVDPHTERGPSSSPAAASSTGLKLEEPTRRRTVAGMTEPQEWP